MSRCGADLDPRDYPLLASVPGHAPDRRLTGPEWFARPGARLPDPEPPAADPWADEGGGWRPA